MMGQLQRGEGRNPGKQQPGAAQALQGVNMLQELGLEISM